MEKVNKIIKSNDLKNTSKIFMAEYKNLRLLLAMRLDVMRRSLENIKKLI